MKISKSKRQLAQLLIDAGVKEFPNGADWAAQGSTDLKASFYSGYKPNRGFGEDALCGNYCGRCHDVQLPSLINNWYETVLSRDEFDQIVAGAVRDADGWIEWKGGDCPLDVDVLVCCKWRSGKISTAAYRAGSLSWRHNGNAADVIAFRLHKPEQAKPESCESVMRSIPEPEANPTIEQLAADYRSKLDIATRAQEEADAHRCGAQVALSKVEIALKELGFKIEPITTKQEPELVITDWRDLQVGDIIEYVDGSIKDKIGMTGPVVEFAPDATDGMTVSMKCDNGPRKGRFGWPMKWRFIRRP